MTRYHRPATLTEALAIRSGEDVAILAGATDIYPAAANRRAWGDPTHKDVLDITAIPGLRGIEEGPHGWRLGCLVTWSDIWRAGLPKQFDGLRQAARQVGGQQVQNRGTILGNLVTASPAGDGIPNLLALNAHVEVAGREGTRMLPVADFLTGYRATALAADEIAVGLHVPKLPRAVSGFRKLGARHYLVISIAMVAAVIDIDENGRILMARLAIGACSATAQRLPGLEAELRGSSLYHADKVPEARHLDHLSPIDDIRATGAYRRDAALRLLRDLLWDLGE
ncbi:FAD binding domain-containing protein [Falsiroseomonas ponticola]|uniref:FAD binding domain-containing protein n=1 Tax=Falsiroseomonas ponticola TaxID=2786951 RepID=UPI0019344FFC|nr:FAD binding domain-containing protein [Roseomonas ponticola]